MSYARVRAFRNVVGVAFGLLLFAAALLMMVGGLAPDALPLCAKGLVGTGPVCPTGRAEPSGGDIMLVALIDAIAAGIAAVAAISNLEHIVDPYNTPLIQGLLKVPIGAFTAILGVIAIEEGLDASAGVPTTQGGILFLAFVFGYSQELVTRVVDRRGATLRGRLAPGHGLPDEPAQR